MNNPRVASAAVALNAYLSFGAGDRLDQRATLVDLLTDLMHWSTVSGIGFDDALVSARNHFSAESGE